ncbi:unnamed protein product [Cunninghamella echinulata]
MTPPTSQSVLRSTINHMQLHPNMSYWATVMQKKIEVSLANFSLTIMELKNETKINSSPKLMIPFKSLRNFNNKFYQPQHQHHHNHHYPRNNDHHHQSLTPTHGNNTEKITTPTEGMIDWAVRDFQESEGSSVFAFIHLKSKSKTNQRTVRKGLAIIAYHQYTIDILAKGKVHPITFNPIDSFIMYDLKYKDTSESNKIELAITTYQNRTLCIAKNTLKNILVHLLFVTFALLMITFIFLKWYWNYILHHHNQNNPNTILMK